MEDTQTDYVLVLVRQYWAFWDPHSTTANKFLYFAV